MKSVNFCKRCKIYKKKLYECCKCGEKLCEKCLIDIFPDADIEKDYVVKHNILTDYCYYKCDKKTKYCNDCGNNYSTVKRCKGCFISLCNNCKIINHKKKKIYDRYNYNLSIADKYEATNYCTISCYIIHTNFGRDTFINCKKCSCYFINPYKYKYCIHCRVENLVEKDVQRNKERKQLQEKLLYLIEKNEIDKQNISVYCQKKIKKYIAKYKNINENRITFDQWLVDTNSGFHSCLNLWDYFINSYI
jgi:hypothetical protein